MVTETADMLYCREGDRGASDKFLRLRRQELIFLILSAFRHLAQVIFLDWNGSWLPALVPWFSGK